MVTNLAPVFTLGGARAAGLRKDQVYDLLAKGKIGMGSRVAGWPRL